MSINFTLEDLYDDTTFNNIVKETNFLVNRRRQQKKRSREWRKYRNAEIAAGRPDPGRNKYTPNRYGSRKYKKEKVKVTTPVPPPPPSEIVLPDFLEMPIDILAELDKINDIPIDILDEILNEINPSGGDN